MSPVARRSEDAILASPDSVERAREALSVIAHADDVGEHLGMDMLAERMANHRFACLSAGYVGWEWVVTVVRVSRARTATINETELLPGPTAILSPPWIAWADRLRPGDLGPGDVLPHQADDPRLDPGYAAQADEDDDDRATVVEMGLGRVRLLSGLGREQAATRWYAGSRGPNAEEAVRAAAPCSTCGFLIRMAGSLGQLFGVCANEWSKSDGRVVSLDHGCGAHSETDSVRSGGDWPAPAPVIDTSFILPFELERPKAPASAGAPGVPGVDDADNPQGQADEADPGPASDIGRVEGVEDHKDDPGEEPGAGPDPEDGGVTA